MPHLAHLLSIHSELPSFLVPVFRMFRGSNVEVVQDISDKGIVQGLLL